MKKIKVWSPQLLPGGFFETEATKAAPQTVAKIISDGGMWAGNVFVPWHSITHVEVMPEQMEKEKP